MSPTDLVLLPLLACPYDGLDLRQEGRVLECTSGHKFSIVQGVPVLLRSDVMQTIELAAASLRMASADLRGKNNDPYFIDTLGISENEKQGARAELTYPKSKIDPVVSFLVAATNGILYKHLVGSLEEYPLPNIRFPAEERARLLEVGCSWGRWSLSAARKGYLPVGIDPSLGAVLAAKRVAKLLELPFEGVVGDARFLPFRRGSFDAVFSYSVLQHFSKLDARTTLREMGRVLRPQGKVLVQMASAFGIRSLQHQLRRGFREPREFEVRYWTPRELLGTFRDVFGRTELEVDCYFGLGLQASDLGLMSAPKRALIRCSEALRKASRLMPPLAYAADSVYMRSGD